MFRLIISQIRDGTFGELLLKEGTLEMRSWIKVETWLGIAVRHGNLPSTGLWGAVFGGHEEECCETVAGHVAARDIG